MDQIIEPWLSIIGCIALLIIGWLFVGSRRGLRQAQSITPTTDLKPALLGLTAPITVATCQPLERDALPTHVAQSSPAEPPHTDTETYASHDGGSSALSGKRSAGMHDRPTMMADDYRWMTNYRRSEIQFLNGVVEDLQQRLWRRTLTLWLTFGLAAAGAGAATVVTLIAAPGPEPQTAALTTVQSGTVSPSSRPDMISTADPPTNQPPAVASFASSDRGSPILLAEPTHGPSAMGALPSNSTGAAESIAHPLSEAATTSRSVEAEPSAARGSSAVVEQRLEKFVGANGSHERVAAVLPGKLEASESASAERNELRVNFPADLRNAARSLLVPHPHAIEMQPSGAGPLSTEQTRDDTAAQPQVGAIAVARHPFPPADLAPEEVSSTLLQTDSWRAAAGLAMALQLNESGNHPEITPAIGKAQDPIQLQRGESLPSRLSERPEVSTTVSSSGSGSAVIETDLVSQQSATSDDGARAKFNALAGISAGADKRPGKPATTGILHEAEAAEISLLPPTSDALPPAMAAASIGEQQRPRAAPEISAVREPLTGIEVVPIPAGCHQMGDVDTGIIEHVCVDGFMLGRTEVTNAQYRRFRPDHHSGRYHGHSLDADDQPVVAVSWRDAVAFTQWLSAQTQRRYRLPTEAEWEYAARADTLTPQPLSIGDGDRYRFVNLEKRPDPKPADEFQGSTVAVESLPANGFGLSGMLGNASEWVEDTYVGGSDRYGDSVHNPLVAIPGPMRVRRGGSFDDPPIMVRYSLRDFYAADLAVPQTGFRIVMEQ